MQDSLAQGQNVSYRTELLKTLESWQSAVASASEKLAEGGWAKAAGVDAAFVDGTAALLADVVSRVNAATDVPTEGAGTPAY
jgi:hypothetical protein